MSKNVLVITGSPRKKGNTRKMAAAFIEAAEARGHTVTSIDANDLKIGFCRECYTCFKTGKPCSFDDDFNEIVAPAVMAADAVVFAMPIYWFSIPANVKLVIDKFCSFDTAHKDFSQKEFGLIASCMGPELVFDGMKIAIERSAAYLHSRVFGEVLIPGLKGPDDVNATDGCAQAAALADKL